MGRFRRAIDSRRLWLAVAVCGLVGCGGSTSSTASESEEPSPIQVAQIPQQTLPPKIPIIKPMVKEPPPPVPVPPDPSIAFFQDGVIPKLKIVLDDAQAQKLREDARKYVVGKLLENGETTYSDVSFKLKGAAGSFRGFDDRPALTVNLDKANKGQKFHGLDKFHLNNSVQDPTYLSELVCYELCKEAGLPAARTTHARVWINQRDLGIYVLKESFNKRFLKLHFKDADGNLYDSGFLQEIDANLERDSGSGPEDRSDLKALVAACREGDAAKRNEKLAELLDIPAFLTFMAWEMMSDHWDGYCRNRNNYRVYFDPATKKAFFFPHGMDQMFGNAGYNTFEHPGGLVANVVMQNPEWRAQYRDRVEAMLPLFKKEKISKRLDELHDRIRPAFAELGEGHAQNFTNQMRGLKDRLVNREQQLILQLRGLPKPLKFDATGKATLNEWQALKETQDSEHEELEIDGKKYLGLKVGPSNECVASWRNKQPLPKGKYKLVARMRCDNVTARKDDSGSGAGVRISGGKRGDGLQGTTDWKDVEWEFEVPNDNQEVVFVLELRATKGRLLINREVRLERL